MKPFGSWFNESAQAVQVETKADLKDEPVHLLITALDDIADRYLDCGCVPCTGSCWGKDELRELISDMRGVAADALKKYRSQS